MSQPDAVGHLIHIGYPKAGSTFLQEWFEQHPQLGYVKGGIAGYSHVWDIAVQAAQPREVRYRVTSAEGLSTPSEETGTEAFRELRPPAPGAVGRTCRDLSQTFPNARVLLVTRGFRSVIGSTYSQYIREAGTLDASQAALAAGELGSSWDYDLLVRTYRAAFGDRLLVMPYELLRDDPARFVGILEDELGLDHAPLGFELVNPSLSPVELAWYPRLSRAVIGLPLPGRLQYGVLNAYVRRTRANRLARAIRVLQRVRPVEPARPELLAEGLVDKLSGRAETLRGNSLYEPYLEDYLL